MRIVFLLLLASAPAIENPFVKKAGEKVENSEPAEPEPKAKLKPSVGKKAIENPFVQNAEEQVESSEPAEATAKAKPKSSVWIKANAEKALDDFYRYQNEIVERGRIYAKTEEEWTDIRIVESNLNKARTHFKAAKRYGASNQKDEWMRELDQVNDVLRRALPQLKRIDVMIRSNGGLSSHRSLND